MIEWYWLLMMMVALHVFADFHLQGILANLKQKGWWYDEFAKVSVIQSDRTMPDIMGMYGKDYIVALWLHAFEWSFIVCIPLMWFVGFTWEGACLVLINMALHAYVDDLKCNQMEISLVTDQLCHLAQILCTLVLWMMYAGE